MPSQETIDMMRRAAIRAAEEAQKQLERVMALEADPGDTYENGVVLHWQRQFIYDGRVYDYVAIKCFDKWWVTGKARSTEAREGLQWSSLYDGWLSHALGPIEMVSEWETVMGE
jgi:hypothetical protein